ncbi:hypothetical protein [Aquisalibacillus elongatus]|uniref:Uncharacterized protein n=1 Tax=Aquisalibacillus elongatus TaxID=485577 RepID=A0A3N5C7R2_9BACI|nr:hypothetical protein [Aquisalibacillus elongatus]RPF54415.1 hypothetical protein EDC24_1614 [Aquisalibacillus elongatus]
MAIYKMKWKERFKESGFVKKFKGFNFKNDKGIYTGYLEPSEGKFTACRNGLAIFDLEPGCWYIIQNTDSFRPKYYYVTPDDKIIEKQFHDIKKYFSDNNNEHFSSNRSGSIEYKFTKGLYQNHSKQNNTETLSKETIFLIDNCEIAFCYLEKNKEIAAGMLITVYNFAELNMLCDKFKQIKNLFKQGKSKNEVKEILLNNKNDNIDTADDILNQFDVS